MTSLRIWVLGTVLGAIAIIALGWFLVISPTLTEAARAHLDRQGVESQNAVLEAELVQLREQFDGIDALRGELDQLRVALPPGLDSASLVRQLNSLAEANGVQLTRIAIEGAGVFTPAPDAAAPEAPVDEAADAAAPETPAADAPAVESIAVAPGVSETNFVLVPISLSVTGAYDAVLAFTQAVQRGERIFLADAVTVAVGGEDASAFEGQIGGLVYVLIDPTLEQAEAAAEETTE